MTPAKPKIVKARHAEATKPGSFYYKNGGTFKGQMPMTREQELAYVETWFNRDGA